MPIRTYNQNHIARKYSADKRRISIYWKWSYPWEAQRDPAAMENRTQLHSGKQPPVSEFVAR